MDPNRFDALTRARGEARSRRGMLKTLGAAALGALGLAGARGGADAAPGGNSAAAAFCHTLFSGSAAGQCTSEAAQGTGPYVDCAGNPANYCNGTCCPADATCQGGACVCAPFHSLCQGTAGSNCCPTGGCAADGTCTCLPDGANCSYFFGTCSQCCSHGVLCDNGCTCHA